MTIKSLLLGSAAALAAVSGAQAADAIVAAEPEPMEYVKVCDAAGSTHYFYIPGTETCLSISGFVRYDSSYVFNTRTYRGDFEYELHFDTWNDTEYGPAYSKLRFEGSSFTNANMTTSADGYFGIGGLELGLYDNKWSSFFGYGAIGGLPVSGSYGFQQNQYVAYTADLGGAKILGAVDFIAANRAGYVLGATGSFGDWKAGLGFGYDSSVSNYTIRGMLTGDLGVASVELHAFYSDAANHYSPAGRAGFSVLGGVTVPVTESVAFKAHAQWFEKPSVWDISGAIDWQVADGFAAKAQVYYTSSTKQTTGYLRIERTF